jgi:hypothetical protein
MLALFVDSRTNGPLANRTRGEKSQPARFDAAGRATVS